MEKEKWDSLIEWQDRRLLIDKFRSVIMNNLNLLKYRKKIEPLPETTVSKKLDWIRGVAPKGITNRYE